MHATSAPSFSFSGSLSGTSFCLSAALLAGALLVPALASASDQIGVYAVVRKVKFEPGPTAGDAVRVRLCGSFALANLANQSYFGPLPGYTYYTCPTGQEALCRMQWSEMLTASTKNDCIAYGQRRDGTGGSNNNGRIRSPTEPVNSPDTYPIGMGMVTVSNPSVEAANVCAQARTAVVDTKPCEDPPPDMAVPPPSTDMAIRPLPPTGSGCSLAGAWTGSARAGAGFLSLLLIGSGALLAGRARRRR